MQTVTTTRASSCVAKCSVKASCSRTVALGYMRGLFITGSNKAKESLSTLSISLSMKETLTRIRCKDMVPCKTTGKARLTLATSSTANEVDRDSVLTQTETSSLEVGCTTSQSRASCPCEQVNASKGSGRTTDSVAVGPSATQTETSTKVSGGRTYRALSE